MIFSRTKVRSHQWHFDWDPLVHTETLLFLLIQYYFNFSFILFRSHTIVLSEMVVSRKTLNPNKWHTSLFVEKWLLSCLDFFFVSYISVNEISIFFPVIIDFLLLFFRVCLYKILICVSNHRLFCACA